MDEKSQRHERSQRLEVLRAYGGGGSEDTGRSSSEQERASTLQDYEIPYDTRRLTT
jgi:hypothetical protein